jgi:hypothetical protein
MEILTVMIERAKVDKEYADIIAGIFEGTYPSHKALNIPFILKSILQGGIYLGTQSMHQLAKGPTGYVAAGSGHSAPIQRQAAPRSSETSPLVLLTVDEAGYFIDILMYFTGRQRFSCTVTPWHW